MTYSHMAEATLPSAQSVFTSEFGKGSGGSRSLMPSGKKGIRSIVLTRVAFERESLNRCVQPSSANRLRLYGQASRAIDRKSTRLNSSH